MSDYHQNIDKIIQQKLKGHKVKAPVNAWSRLQNDLHRPAKRGYFWLTRAAAAAVLLMIAFGGGYFYSDLNRQDDGKMAELPKVDELQTIQNPGSQTADFVAKDDDRQPSIDKNKASYQARQSPSAQNNLAANNQPIITSQDSQLDQNDDRILLAEATADDTETNELSGENDAENANTFEAQKNKIVEQGEAVAENIEEKVESPIENNNTDEIITSGEIPVMSDEMLHQLLISGDDEFAEVNIQEANQALNGKWKIGGRVSPVYSYRSIDGSAIEIPDETVDVGYFNDNENGLTTIGGGISLEYMFNDRLSMGSGMYMSRIGQQNNEVLAYNDPESSNMYKLTTSTGTVTVNPTKFESVIVDQAASAKDPPGDYTVNGSFIQNLDYLEVPLVLKYKVIDKKFSVNVSGGLSPGILVNNRSYFEFEGEKLQTGTTENIDPFIYNSVLGIGLEYAISRKFFINMEPSFKYSLAPVNSNNGIDYHPYSISWFTGISYKID